MALNLADINYSGKQIAELIIRDTYASSLLYTKFGVRIIPSIKSKFVWHDISIDLTINDGSPVCPTFNTDFTLTQNNGELCPYHVAGSINHDSLIGTYRELMYKNGVLVERVSDDADLFSAMMLMLFESILRAQDNKWLNDDATYNCSNGLLAQFENDEYSPGLAINKPVPAGQKLTAVAITAANVQSELSRIIAALPGKYKYGSQSNQFGTPKFAVSYNVMDAYNASLIYTAPPAAGGNGNSIALANSYTYELIPVDGLPDNTIFLTPADNIMLVVDSEADLTNLVVADGLQDSTLCKKYVYRLDYRTAIFFGDGDAVVYYR